MEISIGLIVPNREHCPIRTGSDRRVRAFGPGNPIAGRIVNHICAVGIEDPMFRIGKKGFSLEKIIGCSYVGCSVNGGGGG